MPTKPAPDLSPLSTAHSLEELARHVNLAVATVSRALNGSEKVNSKTRARVVAAAEELGYRPSPLARGLRTGRSGLVGICFYMSSPGRNVLISQQLYFLQKQLSLEGKRTLVEFSAWGYPEKRRTIEHFLSMNVDGVIHTGSFPPELLGDLERWRQMGIPYALLDPTVPGLPCSVMLNRRSIYTRMTDYLLDLGHRRFVTLGMARVPGYEQRFQGIRDSLERRGLSFEECVEVCVEQPFPLESAAAWGHRLAERFYPQLREATACFASNDDVAIGAIRWLKQKGVGIPHDLSVIGFDDAGTAAFNDPSITTATQEVEATAMRALSMLSAAWKGGAEAVIPSEEVEPVFLIRESSGAAPSDRRE